MFELLKNSRILVVVAHPDDEILGVGGLIHSLSAAGNDKIRVVILGEGLTSRSPERGKSDWLDSLGVHRDDAIQAQKELGYGELKMYALPDNRFDSIDLLDVVKIVEAEKVDFEPEYVFTHHGGDLNIDHRVVFQSVMTSFRPVPGEIYSGIITFETMSGTEWRPSTDPHHFIPNLFVEISVDSVQAKCAAMECYDFEKRDFPHPRSPRSIKTRAEAWGVVNGWEYAEAFCVVRMLVRCNDLADE